MSTFCSKKSRHVHVCFFGHARCIYGPERDMHALRQCKRIFKKSLIFLFGHGIIGAIRRALPEERGAEMSGALAELKKILQDVEEKTGLSVHLAPSGGEETRFQLEYCGERTDVWIGGAPETAEREAKLVQYLIGNADSSAILPDKSEALKTILLGEGTGWYAFRFLTKYNLADGRCFAVDIVPDRRLSECCALVERCLAETQNMAVRMDDSRLAVVCFSDGEESAYEFGSFLRQSLYEELGVRASVGIGCEMRSFSDIPLSYHQAVTAVRMSAIMHADGEVHSYREYLLVKILEDLPRSRLKEYSEQFRTEDADEVFADDELVETAEAFLESSLNVSETSRNLFMHRNTLMYRLDKIERVTGLNIRKFSDAVTFRILCILYKLLQSS